MSWEATAVEMEVTDDDATSGFTELGAAVPTVAALKQQDIMEPFPTQRATIADAIVGHDALGRGRAGSGKTPAFGLPLLTRLAVDEPTGSPRIVILTPIRELALQIADNLSLLAIAMGLRLHPVAGGVAHGPRIKALERDVDVAVVTPDRLIDLLEQGIADLSRVEVMVLDEADHMSDLEFPSAVTTTFNAVPADGQRPLFFATLDGVVDGLVKCYLANPVTCEVDSDKALVTTMTRHVLRVIPYHKNQVTAEIANREDRTAAFACTQMGTDRIVGQLHEVGVMAGTLHSGLTRGIRTRILAALRRGEVPVLVATDVTAHGIHVDDISLVLQVSPPKINRDYLHRAGRTARVDEEGAAVSVALLHQRKQVRRIVGQAGVKTEPAEVVPDSDEFVGSAGARPRLGAPTTEADYQALTTSRPQQRRRPGGGRGRGSWRRSDRRDRGHREERGQDLPVVAETTQVRLARAADASGTSCASRTAFVARRPVDPPADALSDILADVERVLAEGWGVCALDGDRMIGCLLAAHDGEAVRLRRVSVLPSKTRRGIAKAIIGGAISLAVGAGLKRVEVLYCRELPELADWWGKYGFGLLRESVSRIVLGCGLPAAVTVLTPDAMHAPDVELAGLPRAGDVVIATGELGVGGATLARGIGEGLGVEGPAISPTLVLSRTHPSRGGGPDLVYVDAYCMVGAGGLADIDFDATLPGSATLVEWGEGIAGWFSDERLEIDIDREIGGEAQRVTLTGTGPRWAGVLEALRRNP